MSEAIWGLVEHSYVQKGNLPKDCYRDCWEVYAAERYKKSRVFREYFKENFGWYIKGMDDVAKKLDAQDQISRSRQ
ncbi:hypothetical protein [Microvirga tunisiensis]|uniref:Uncharacterized protein n=1 Tax=Microvirga tunisiensis TaxID=2108360 RepID=A0A5N7MU13_9HYPH|nr:hypothetical protein [Microvirga tunisiensis]MPR12566.1 hypothetical protein [Microvirga tunisiensis]MPR30471.1 hypothetical protein [Microvirga tunisiensis]